MSAECGVRILPCGDAALVAEFGDTIEPTLNRRVLALDALAADLPGVVETVPTYRSLLIYYDPFVTGHAELADQVRMLAANLPDRQESGRTWRVPVVYGGEYGVDLEPTARLHGMSADELVRRHSGPVYQVYMIGFLPGYAYLGGLDPTIATPRRTTPRLHIPAGSISIGGVQALVTSIAAPSGWHLLGRTPVRNYMPTRTPVVLLLPGDRISFAPIDAAEFAELDRAAAAGKPVTEIVGEQA